MSQHDTESIDERLKLNMLRRAEKIAGMGIRMHACTAKEFEEMSQRMYEAVDVLQLQIRAL